MFWKQIVAYGCGWISLVASAMLLSLGAVLTFATLVGSVGLVYEAEHLVDRDYVSINDCVIRGNGQAVASLFWFCPANGPFREARLGFHKVSGDRSAISAPWPEIHTTCLASSPGDDRFFFGGIDGAIYTASLSQPEPAPVLLCRQPDGDVYSLECSPDKRHLLSFGRSSLCAWNSQSGAQVWCRDNLEVNCLTFDFRSNRAILGMRDGRLIEIDIDSGRTIRSIKSLAYPVVEVAIGPDGRHLASTGADGRVLLLNWPTGTTAWQDRDPPSHIGGFKALCFSPCGRFLITTTRDNVQLLSVRSVETGDRLGELQGHTRAILGATFAADGRLLSWGADGTIRAWDVRTLKSLGVVSLSLPVQAS